MSGGGWSGIIGKPVVGFVVAVADVGVLGQQFFDVAVVLCHQLDVNRAGVVQQVFSSFGTRDRNDIGAAVEYPADGQLGRGPAVGCCVFGKGFSKLLVVLGVIALVTGEGAPEILIAQLAQA